MPVGRTRSPAAITSADATRQPPDAAFRLVVWHDFAVVLGGAAAALIGLVFVAGSIQLRALAHDDLLRQGATSSVLVLFTIVAAAAAILAPQSRRLAGVEFLLLVLTSMAFSRGGLREPREERLSRFLVAVRAPTGVLGIVGDISLIAQRGYGCILQHHA